MLTSQQPVHEEGDDMPTPSKKEKMKSKPTAILETDSDADMNISDAPVVRSASSMMNSQAQENFSALYLRKVTVELADDLDKVREAQDFKASSVPMLIHALKQGESLYSVEEKRRVVGAAHV